MLSSRIYKLVGLFSPSDSSLGWLSSTFLVLTDVKHLLLEPVKLDINIIRYDFE